MNKIWWIILIAVVVGAWWAYSHKTMSLPGYGVQSQSSVSPSPKSKAYKPAQKMPVAPDVPATPVAPMDYTTLIRQYVGYEIQFDALCHGTPGQMVVKNGQSILLDNRSPDTKTIKLGSQSYVLPGYNYRVVMVSTSNLLPYLLGVDCKSDNGNTGSGAVINIQALIYQ